MKPPSNLTEFCTAKFGTFKSFLYKNYGENPGKMLVHTGVLGWVLSSLAQVTAVIVNDKISPKEKVFLIPQECADATVNILSFYLVTNSFKAIGSKLVSMGKLANPAIKSYLQKNNLTKKIGKLDFDIAKENTFADISGKYKPFKNGVDVIFSTVGSIISCNLITPVLRNQYASRKQKEIMAKRKGLQTPAQTLKMEDSTKTTQSVNLAPVQKPVTMGDYQKMAAIKFSGSGMKI